MAGYRNRILHRFGGMFGMLPPGLLRKLSGQKLILPFYHAVSDEALPHIRNLYQVKSVRSFTQDMDFLLKHYEPIDYVEFKRLKDENKEPKKPSFLLSFDDGLKEFHDVIGAILLQKGIPAICFLNSRFVDNKDLFFRYKASLLINRIQSNLQDRIALADLFGGEEYIQKKILAIRYDESIILDEAATKIGLSFDEFLKVNSPYLTTDQIKSLIAKGFQFGTHSIDHPQYQYLNLEEQIRQTRESVQFVKDTFSLDYGIFSFPFTDFGVSKTFFSRLKTDSIVDVSFGSAGQKHELVSNHFQRIPFETGDLTARQIHNSEFGYYLFKSLMGKNIIQRHD